MQRPYVIMHQAFRLLLGLLQFGILYIDDGGARTRSIIVTSLNLSPPSVRSKFLKRFDAR